MKKYILSAALAAVLGMPAFAGTFPPVREYIVVTNANGNRIFTGEIDYGKESIKFDGDNVIISVKDADPKTFAKAEIGEIQVTDYRVADLFDAVWNADGTVKDFGKFNLTVQFKGREDRVKVDSENPYGVLCPTFANEYAIQEKGTLGGSESTVITDLVGSRNAYYQASYGGAEVKGPFEATIANGFAAETIFRIDSDVINEENDATLYTTAEAKPFSCTQSGGFGFSVRPASEKRNLCFMVAYKNTKGAASYYSCKTGVRPEKGVYYHAISVWNPANKELKLYINGELAATVANANGEFYPVSAANKWLGIGSDPYGANSESSFPGQVVMSRLYDAPLADDEVQVLFQKAIDMKTAK